jgi:hypothetical protein
MNVPAPPTHNRSCLERFLRAAWLRGFLPGLTILLLAVYSTFFMIHWQAPLRPGASQPLRASLRKGVFIANWEAQTSRTRTGIQWSLGVMIHPDKSAKPGWFGHPLRPSRPLRWPDLDFETTPGHLKVPLVSLGVILLIPAGVAAWIRNRSHPPWACPGCGYDLRDTPLAAPCPECGRARPLPKP